MNSYKYVRFSLFFYGTADDGVLQNLLLYITLHCCVGANVGAALPLIKNCPRVGPPHSVCTM